MIKIYLPDKRKPKEKIIAFSLYLREEIEK